MDQTLETLESPGAAERETLSSKTDMCYVLAFEEDVSESKRSELVVSLSLRNVYPEMRQHGVLASPSMQLLVLQMIFGQSVVLPCA